MSPFAPTTHLATHDVGNQPGDLVDRNLYADDIALREAVLREAGAWLDERAMRLGAVVGSQAVVALGQDANRFPPELTSFDRFGRRIDEVRFNPSYHALMALATDHEIHSLAWTTRQPGGHVAHAALLAVFAQSEAGTMCPINMTYAAVPALRVEPNLTAAWIAKVLSGCYDAPLRPIEGKAGVTLGMAMTEKQGGSDVRANTTRADARQDGTYGLIGHKWFCSAPMSDGFLTLAQAPGGLTCFLVPRIAPDSTRNGIHLMRLKDKLGNRSNASAEIEYEDAAAFRLGPEGSGVKVIIDMVHHTRLGTIACTLGIMRAALSQAVHHTSRRMAFGKPLIAHPLMTAVLADLALDYEAAVVLVMRVARAFSATDESERAFARLGVALAKYWLTKRCSNFVYEAMECLGGAGYVEDGPMPRLYREAPLNAIWEGSGNVIALDVLRTLAREPAARAAYEAELAPALGIHAAFDSAAQILREAMSETAPAEARARHLVERMAVMLQGALLIRYAPSAVSDAFCMARIASDHAFSYGALACNVDLGAIMDRQTLR
ncbi:acyl-CoA dehydrogenase family protein [Lichenihabitans psoromatis]|uniref:acyl-CoA dehydrogenase family protein n=1 Tax=Lichenihabitans psoromatis TaxID=2528642 RepID=UPI0010385801|nr:acyl-CoA dehydrogenase family protein [Lichenihabitans psoromatis]